MVWEWVHFTLVLGSSNKFNLQFCLVSYTAVKFRTIILYWIMSTPATKEDIEQIIASMTARHEAIVVEKVAEVTAKFEAKLKAETETQALKWKREGHKKQYTFNKTILDSLEELKDHQLSPETQNKLEDIKKDINKRQKLIRIADTSPSGWATVEEYETKEMAEDSDDDRRLQRSEARAARKLKAAQKSNFQSPSAKRFRRQYPAAISSPGNSNQQLFRAQQTGTRFRSYPVATDTCYACGGAGHWRKHCTAYTKYKHTNQTANQSGSISNQ